MSASQIDVEHLFTITVTVGDTSNALIRGGPSGSRLIAAVEGGTFSGDRLSGTVIPPGGDWVTLRDDRTIKLDVRILLVTDDGESILMTYQGIGIPSEGGPTQLRTAPSSDKLYALLTEDPQSRAA